VIDGEALEGGIRDATRPVGALVKAVDAVEVLTDGLTLEQVVERLESLVAATVQASKELC
jgi:cytidylate kinase